jgi:hypothetical protein
MFGGVQRMRRLSRDSLFDLKRAVDAALIEKTTKAASLVSDNSLAERD